MSITSDNNIKKKKKLTAKQELLMWRRNQVLQMSMAGATQNEISRALKISQASVSADYAYIKEESRQQLQSVIYDIIPLQWRRTRAALQFVERESLQLWKDAKNDVDKRQALALFTDTYSKEFELCANSTILDEALKFVSNNNIKQALDELKEQQKQKEENTATVTVAEEKELDNDLPVNSPNTPEED